MLTGADPEKQLERLIEQALYPQICALFRQFPKDLLRENGDELLVRNSATQVVPAAQQAAAVQVPSSEKKTATATASGSKDALRESTATCTVTLRTEFKCAASDLYQALTNPERSRLWAAGAELKAEAGYQFELFGGNIRGTVLECETDRKVRWRWAMKQWGADVQSEVTLLLDQGADSTVIRLTHVCFFLYIVVFVGRMVELFS